MPAGAEVTGSSLLLWRSRPAQYSFLVAASILLDAGAHDAVGQGNLLFFLAQRITF